MFFAHKQESCSIHIYVANLTDQKMFFLKQLKLLSTARAAFSMPSVGKNHCRREREVPAATTRRTVNILQKTLERI